jgi:hypothetical protein
MSGPQLGGSRAVTYAVDDDLVHTAEQVGLLYNELQQLGSSLDLRADGYCWMGRGAYNTRQLNAFLESLLRNFSANAPVLDVYNLATALDATLHRSGHKTVTKQLLKLFRRAARSAGRDIDSYLSIIDRFIDSTRSARA